MNVEAVHPNKNRKALWWVLAALATVAFYAVAGGFTIEPEPTAGSRIALTLFDFVFHAFVVLIGASLLSLIAALFVGRGERYRSRFLEVLPMAVVAVSLLLAAAFVWVKPLGPVPVGGPSAPGAGPAFRIRLGNPLLLEDVLAEYPELRVYLMHAGGAGPFMDHALYMMAVYPQVYVDVGILTWVPGGEEILGEFLRKAKEWGALDRVMFGTDQLFWPEAIGMVVERVNGYDFLTVEEKAGVLYENAARFLGLSEAEIARHHGQ